MIGIYGNTRKVQLLYWQSSIQPNFFTDWNNWCAQYAAELRKGHDDVVQQNNERHEERQQEEEGQWQCRIIDSLLTFCNLDYSSTNTMVIRAMFYMLFTIL